MTDETANRDAGHNPSAQWAPRRARLSGGGVGADTGVVLGWRECRGAGLWPWWRHYCLRKDYRQGVSLVSSATRTRRWYAVYQLQSTIEFPSLQGFLQSLAFAPLHPAFHPPSQVVCCLSAAKYHRVPFPARISAEPGLRSAPPCVPSPFADAVKKNIEHMPSEGWLHFGDAVKKNIEHMPSEGWLHFGGGMLFISCKVPSSSLPCKDFCRAWPSLRSTLRSIPLRRE
ncbi:uncharacterized protein [Anomalospiza imberbis]|uniref:uncharacterized protein n=1 Tax=Anomalospiza imberbis TaxID=187417 RepID=UPI00358E2790